MKTLPFRRFSTSGGSILVALVSSFLFASVAVTRADPQTESKPAGATASASVQASKDPKAKAPAKPKKVKKVIITGSNIPEPVKRRAGILDTQQSVYLIDRAEIERSGATTVSQVLRRVPFGR